MRARWWAGALLVLAGGAAAQQDTRRMWFDLPSPVGHEEPLLAAIEADLSVRDGAVALDLQRDALGSLIVRRAGAPQAAVRLLLAVGVDEPSYAISQIRDDGLLRVRTLARKPTPELHLAREGRPVRVYTRDGSVPGVLLVNSLHLRAARPEVFGEENLWLDVGADSPADVAALGIELLDPVVMHEAAQLAGPRQAGVAAGTRVLVRELVQAIELSCLCGQLPDDVAFAFVAQSQVGTGPLGRGGEAVVRRLAPAETLVLRVAEGGTEAVTGPTVITFPATITGVEAMAASATAWKALDLRVLNAGTPVELVDEADALQLAQRLKDFVGWSDVAHVGRDAASVTVPDGEDERPEFTLLAQLVAPRGVSGHEGPVRDEVRAQLAAINPAWQPQQDAAGNLVLVLGDGPRTLAVVAHMDEIGLEVTAIRPDGLLETRRLGGMLDHLFRETLVELVTHDGQVLPGIALPKPKDAPKVEEPAAQSTVGPLLDVGARSAAQAEVLGVAVGDTATVPKELNALGAHRAAGRSPDDRVGCTALLLALRELGPDADADLRAAGRRVVFAWSTREETGLDGSDALARTLRPVPEVVFAVDTFVTSDSPIEDPRYAFAKLGGGPVLRALDNTSLTPRATLDRVRAVAEPADVTLQIGVMGGGNDGSRFVPEGSIDCPLAWPQRCSHSRVETLDLRDLATLATLIAAVARDF